MKEMLFKTHTSVEQRKKDLFMAEIKEQNGVVKRTQRRWIYTVKGAYSIEDSDDLKHWVRRYMVSKGAPKLKELSIFRRSETKEGWENFAFKLEGDLYLITKDKIYLIGFIHLVNIDLVTLTKGKPRSKDAIGS